MFAGSISEEVFSSALSVIIVVFGVYLIYRIIAGGKKPAKPVGDVPAADAAFAAREELDAPVAYDSDGDEIVAVIAAAVAAMSPDYRVTGISVPARVPSRRRSAWGKKGVSESTAAFSR
jgi:hypothetical protein